MRPCVFLLLSLAACSSGGNLSASHDLHGPPPPPIHDPYFRPDAPPGSVPARWLAPVWDQHGTIVRPRDPIVERGHPDYDHAPWLGTDGPGHPSGTF